ncbi:MAG: hypothetical protein DRH24_12070 [Deltaproteobacteria bacterium]|nr:MAG: hypothetical protein DRH24_12070 [Deltaproteobacteria bacterium]
MRDLIAQERFELEVLDQLNSSGLLRQLVFTGGTMLRLCFGLERFSVDLDFWVWRGDPEQLFHKLREVFSQSYMLKDCANKFYTLLFELKAEDYPRSLKVEVRKNPPEGIRTEQAIAYSKHSDLQVLVRVVTLQDMMRLKVNAFLERGEIRDVYDIEFLLRKGIALNLPEDTLRSLLDGINSLKKRDYTVKLGSLLEEPQRRYYIEENFKLLKAAIREKLAGG